MTRVAALDCGTNSLRLLVTDLADGAQTDVHREMRLVRLGEGVDRTGRLSDAALERTRVALVDYAGICRALGAQRVRLVATSATRDASNREQFVSVVFDALGVRPDVVSGADEAALSFAGATKGLSRADAPFLVMDIGGGSTELVVGTDAVNYALSMDIGCVRLSERHLHDDPPTPSQVRAAEADIDAVLAPAVTEILWRAPRTALGLAGSVTTVAAHALALPAYDAEVLHLTRLPADEVVRACTSLLEMSRAHRAALPYMHPGRVDVIGAGALVLRTLVDRLSLPEVVVSEADILDGIAWSMAPSDRE
ncbi:MAG TPA: Ppx/GppA phosphatase family protein [Mycobacteriales bacterium]|nr:Ppx/GppA phosphatase family protein [Mycobacteriales bacterium]